MTPAELVPALRTTDRGLVVSCHVQPGAPRTSLAGVFGDALKIKLAAPPVDGRANAELCAFFAKKLHIPKTSAQLVSGQTSRDKRVLLSGVAVSDFTGIFSE